MDLEATMAEILGVPGDPAIAKRRTQIIQAIDTQFASHGWRYLAGVDDDRAQEGLGIAFAVLFKQISGDAARELLEGCYCSDHGIPCLYPAYQRYTELGGLGRHSGMVWPHVNALFAAACATAKADAVFESELRLMAAMAYRCCQFPEIVDPNSGEIDGGLQEYAGSLDDDWAEWYIRRCNRRDLCGAPRSIMERNAATDLVRHRLSAAGGRTSCGAAFHRRWPADPPSAGNWHGRPTPTRPALARPHHRLKRHPRQAGLGDL